MFALFYHLDFFVDFLCFIFIACDIGYCSGFSNKPYSHGFSNICWVLSNTFLFIQQQFDKNFKKRNVMSYNTFYPEINTFWPVRFVNSTALWYKFFIFQMILSIVVECPMQSTAGHHLLYALGYAHIASMVDNNNTMVQAC